MTVFDRVKEFLSENQIRYDKYNSCIDEYICIKNCLVIKNVKNSYHNIGFRINNKYGLELVENIVYSLALKEFSYSIIFYSESDINDINIEFMPLFGYNIMGNFSYNRKNITSLFDSNFCFSIFTSPKKFIKGCFNKRYPVLITCLGIKDINSILNLIEPNKIIIRFKRFNECLSKTVNQLFNDGKILALTYLSDEELYIKYKDKELNFNSEDKISYFGCIIDIVMENRNIIGTKSAANH